MRINGRTFVLLSLLIVPIGSAGLFAAEPGAAAPAPAAAAEAAEPAPLGGGEPMFDALAARPDVIYLMANSSLVFGPDPHGRSEEITFAGLVTVPKYPMTGYDRRKMNDGRQEIDIELTASELAGESYLLGGTVKLGEHPDLRSLGTIAQNGRRAQQLASNGPVYLASNTAQAQPAQQRQAGTAARNPNAVDVRVTPRTAELIARHPNILWDDLIAAEVRMLAKDPKLKTRVAKKVIPTTVTATTQTFTLPADVRRLVDSDRDVDWAALLSERVDAVVTDLGRRRLVAANETDEGPATIPNDFTVARKVLITTAKGILYNETPVPVRGRIDSIPPVKRPSTPVGVNVFLGMELPVPLLDADGNVDGWFYSKAHMAYAVLPEAIQRNEMEGTITITADGKSEQVTMRGPVEFHLRELGPNAAGERQTETEIMVLSLRGKSELLGGDLMMIEAFSDRDRFSKGVITWKNGKPSPVALDLYAELYTPSGKLTNAAPIRFNGTIAGFKEDAPIERGTLRIPLHAATGPSAFTSTSGSELVDEAGRPAVAVTAMQASLKDVVVR